MSEPGNNVPVMQRVQARVDKTGVLLERVRIGSLTIHPPTSTPYHRIVWRTVTGQRKQTMKGRTFKEASAAADAILDELESGTDKGGETVYSMIDNYLDPTRVRRGGTVWSINTHAKTAWLFKRYITPVIGQMRCRGLTNKSLIAVIEQKPAPSPDTQKRLRGELARLVKDGYEHGFLSTPPEQLMRGVRTAGQGAKGNLAKQGQVTGLRQVERHELPTSDQIADLAVAMSAQWRETDAGEVMIYLLAYSGLRLGEMLALRAGDIETAKRHINVTRQVLHDGHTITAPKGAKARTAVYPKRTPPTKHHPKGFPLDSAMRKLTRNRPSHLLLFPATAGKAWNRSNFYTRRWNPAYWSANWPENADESRVFTPHVLRHVAAVYWLWERKKSARAVSDMLGHGNTHITLSVYGDRGSRLDEFDD
mgnify:FL=1